jgi:ATP-binding cassette, subfamily C, bacterial CydD
MSGAARWYVAGAVGCGIATTGLIVAQAGLLAHVLANSMAGVSGLAGAFAALLAVAVGRAAASYGGEVTALRAADAVKGRLRTRLLTQALDRGPGWLGRQPSGEIATLATSGLDSLDAYYARYLPQMLLAVLVPVVVTVSMLSVDWVSGLIVVVTVPVIPVFAGLIGLHTKTQTRRSWALLARLSGHFLDVVQGLATLKVFGRAKTQEQIIARVTEEYRASVMANLRVAFLSALVLELAAAVATALVAVEVGLRLLYGHLEYSTALFLLLLTPEAFLPLRNAATAFHASADGTAAAAKIFEILEVQASSPARTGLPVPDLRRVPIRLEDVTLAYPGRAAPVIERASLTIWPGDQITLVGSNGAGKTTLLQALLQFIEYKNGRVLVGDAELSAVAADAWRAQIGWLPQRPALFPWSVKENITLGRPGAGTEAVERAASLAGAAGFIASLPQGYDTALGERALRLSAGERHKIALARLFLRDAPLLLLDEPTAHLDPVSAAQVEVAIGTLAAGRTVITVAHRLPAEVAGRVLLVEDGRVRELNGVVGGGCDDADDEKLARL